MAKPQKKQDQQLTTFDDLRAWMQQVDEIGQLEHVKGAHWDLEIGALNEIICERLPAPPALLFENIAGHEGEGRVLANMMETMERTALTLNLPLELSTIEVIDRLRSRLRALEPLEPRIVSTGPVMENRKTGKDLNILDIPVPRWHAGDGGRYLGTAHLVVTRDPETQLENVGCYRVMVHDKDKIALYISPGKHGRMHVDKTLREGKPVPVAMAFGQHPLMFVAASQAVPPGMNEYAWAGGLVGQPLSVIEAPITGLRVPAAAEIVIEGEIVPGDTLPEGPFGEWTGYYASARRAEPVVQLKAIYHRGDPILTAAPPFRPTIHGMYRSMLRSAMIWNGIEQGGVPDICGVYVPPPAQRFMIVVAIRQRYPGHAKQAALMAAQCHAGAYLGRYVVVVDDDVDITNLNEVVWAMCTRSNPEESIDIIRRTWSGPLDPIIPRDRKGLNSRAIIDATRPFEWKDQFPAVSEIDKKTHDEVSARWKNELDRLVRGHQR